MQILWICKRYYTNKDLVLDHFGRLYHFPIELGNQGFSSEVIAVDYFGRNIVEYKEDNTHFRTLPVMSFRLIHAWQAIHRYMHESRPDIVIASGDTHFGWLGLRLAKQHGLPFVFDIYDDYRTFGTSRLPGMKQLFLRLVKNSDAIVCSSQNLAHALDSYAKRAYVIGNGVDTELFRQTDQLKARTALGIPADAPVIGYFGALQREFGVETLLEACALLKHKLPGLRLLLAGHNRLGAQLVHDFVDYRGNVPQILIPQLISACNVVTMPYHRGPQVDMSNPCKLAEYLACNTPIVATRVTDLPILLAQCPKGLCEPGDTASLAAAILDQLQTPCIVKFPQEFTWQSLAKKLGDGLRAIL